MEIQSILLLIVSVLIIVDMYLTYATYKQTEKDYTSMKYDIEITNTDLGHHKDYINSLIKNVDELHAELERQKDYWHNQYINNSKYQQSIADEVKLLKKKKVGRPKKDLK